MRWLMRPAMPQDVSVSTRVDGERAFVEVETREQSQGGFALQTRAEARLVTPTGQVKDLPLRQVGPGKFTGEFSAIEAGAYLANISFARAGAEGDTARAGSVQAAVSVPYPAEYRSIRDNAAVLRAVAERTGGRVLRLADAKTWELFDRSDLGSSSSARALWQLAAVLAAVLILLDVAWRRIAFDRRDAVELAGRLTGGVGASQGAGSGGVDALRRARSGSSSPEATAGGAGATGGGSKVQRTDAGTRFEAAAGGRPLDSGDLAGADRAGPAAGGTPRPTNEPGVEEDGLARLRNARRRRQDSNEGDGPDQSRKEGEQ